MDKITLHNLLDLVTEAVHDACSAQEGRSIETYRKNFDEGGKPKTLKILAGDSEIEVPECALINHNITKLKTIDFQFEGRVETVEDKLCLDLSAANNGADLNNQSKICLKISFDTDSAPESRLRINDRFIEII
jgi:hypothetical protein